MKRSRLQSSQHIAMRNFFRTVGPIVLIAGAVCALFGLVDILTFMSDGVGLAAPKKSVLLPKNIILSTSPHDFPKYFWCVPVGVVLMMIGGQLCYLGFMGVMARYVAAEQAPVVKDTVNYMGENTTSGVKAFSKAATSGVLDAQEEHRHRRRERKEKP